MLLLMANSTIRHLLDQSFWSFDTMVRSIWAIDLLAHSVAPSVWGWNTVDLRSLLPINICSSFQNMEVNLVSWLDTMDSGIPWSLCYKFILIFKGSDCQIMIYSKLMLVCGTQLCNQCMRVAKSWEFGCLMTVASWAWVPKGQVAWKRDSI